MTVRYVDVRATRFAGALTWLSAVLGLALQSWLVAAGTAGILLAAAWGGPRLNAWGHLWRLTIKPRLAAPTPAQREPERPPRFANLLGGVFLLGAAIAWLAAAPIVASVLAGTVALLAFLNAAFGLCVGCRLYGILVHDGPVVTYLGLR